MSYIIQEANYFVNYLFKKDLTFTRLKDTSKLTDTICYTKEQSEIVLSLHPDAIPLNYKRSTKENHKIFQANINRMPSEQLKKIINYLNK